MLQEITPAHWLTLHGLATSLAVLIYVLSSHAMHQRRQPTAAIAWILFILLMPYLALPLYLLFGFRKVTRPRHDQVAAGPALSGNGHWAIDTIMALGQPAPRAYKDLSLHQDGQQASASLLQIIDQAQSSIDICTFILGRDPFGQKIVDQLCDKLKSGVRVRLMLDGIASLIERPPNLKRLLHEGGEFALFAPPLRSGVRGHTNLRDHRKLLVADAGLPTARLWCGGRNLAANYFEGSADHPPWRDLSFDLGGAVVQQASDLFNGDWAFAKRRPSDKQASSPPACITLAHPSDGAQLVASGPDQADDTLLALLVTATYRAHRRILLASPYFVPDPSLLMALCLAARRGVAIDLLVPARSNHRLSDLARGRALRTLTEAGGRVWLAPTMMHGKLAVFDESLALAGSANLDSRSLQLNYELMLAFHHTGDVRRFAAWFDLERQTAKRSVLAPASMTRDLIEGLLLWVGFQL